MGDMPAADPRPTVRHLQIVPQPPAQLRRRPYGDAMTTADQITAALRRNLPDVTPGRIHRLLYLAQGHHAAWFDEPLFDAAVMAWDNGVIVPAVRGRECEGDPGYGTLDNKTLNTVGYVCSRYGNLQLHDLDLITRHSTPVLDANRSRHPGTGVRVDHAAMAAYFRTVDADPDAPIIDADRLAAHRAAATDSRDKPAEADDLDAIRAWARGLRTKAAAQGA